MDAGGGARGAKACGLGLSGTVPAGQGTQKGQDGCRARGGGTTAAATAAPTATAAAEDVVAVEETTPVEDVVPDADVAFAAVSEANARGGGGRAASAGLGAASETGGSASGAKLTSLSHAMSTSTCADAWGNTIKQYINICLHLVFASLESQF